MPNSRRKIAVVLVAIMLAGAAQLRAQEQDAPVVGQVKVVTGTAFIVRAGQQIPAELGQPIRNTDGLRTGDDGRIGVTLRDDTRVALGPGSEVRIDHYVYDPGQNQMGFALRIMRGIAAYVSGQMAKLAPDSIRLETPAATVGVRGTTLAFHVSSAS